MAVLLASATSAGQETGGSRFSFALPAQAAGDIKVSNATWAFAAFDDLGAVSVDLTTASPARQTNITQILLAKGDAAEVRSDGFAVPVTSEGTVAPFAAHLEHHLRGRASFFAQGEGLDIDARAVTVEVVSAFESDCIGRFVRSEESNALYDARYRSLCLASPGPVLVLRTEPGASLTMGSRRLDAAEWHNLQSACSTAACPASSDRQTETSSGPNWNLTTGRLSFTRLGFGDGASMALHATPRLVILGGSAIDLTVEGWLRMPDATGDACAECSDGVTVKMAGAIHFDGLHVAEPRRLEGRLAGDVDSAHLDELSVDPVVLMGQVPVAAVVTAAAAGVVLVAKALLGSLFTRLRGEEALEHPNRKRLLESITRDPGINFRGLVRASGIAAGTVRHHLTILVRAGVVTEQGLGSTRRFFAGPARGDWEQQVLLREPGLRQLYDWVAANPGTTQMKVLDAMVDAGWSRSTTQHRLTRLGEAGVLQVRLQGRYKRYWTDAAKVPDEVTVRPAAVRPPVAG